tara:strand:+ start:505 stop:636 length:132 start_codon:yes stop_codon:yes gene_type:complete
MSKIKQMLDKIVRDTKNLTEIDRETIEKIITQQKKADELKKPT